MMFYLIISFAYLFLGIFLVYIEKGVIKRKGFFAYHILLIFYFIYIIIPSFFIYGILFISPNETTGVFFFDKTYKQMTYVDSFVLFLLNIIFMIGFYLCIMLFKTNNHIKTFEIKIYEKRSILWILFGLFLIFSFFLSLGDSFDSRYANLILFRNQDDSVARNFFNANAFSLTQTFAWLSAGLFFVFFKKNGWKIKVIIFLILTILFAFSQGSRRGLIFPVLIYYLCNLLYTGKVYWLRLLVFFSCFFIWISIGKELTGNFARTGNVIGVNDIYNTYTSMILRAFSDIGISQVQSLATLQYFDFSYRLGVDHILSFLRRVPFKEFFGIQDIYPERITRITTSLFVSPDELDIPPGLFGASWLDFPFLGAFFWGFFLSIQCVFVDRIYLRTKKTPESIMLVVIIMVIISMPVNTGSYDFTASVDIFVLFLIFWTIFKRKRINFSISRFPTKPFCVNDPKKSGNDS